MVQPFKSTQGNYKGNECASDPFVHANVVSGLNLRVVLYGRSSILAQRV